ncbi:MAG: CotH kinase family protein [Saprospiraceae bacterium]
MQSQVVINEICSANEENLLDQFGEASDWIELYNIDNQSINLADYHLSDDESGFLDWQFPAIEVPAQSFLIVFASNRDLADLTQPHTDFKLSKSGEKVTLSDANGNIVDQVLTPPLKDDVTYGRVENGSTEWAYFDSPTPAASNNGAEQTSRAAVPIFSETNQFHTATFELDLTCTGEECIIYYTTDGSEPTDDSPVWESPLRIEKNTVIRAFVDAKGQLDSKIVSRTFFINAQHDLPIIALSTESALLFDEETGLFEKGPNADPDWPFLGANFWNTTEIPVAIEYFKNETLVADFHIGAKMHGGRGARTRAQKPMRLLAEHQYGVDKVDYKFFPDKEISSFERIVLRNASGDFNAANFRDGYLARLFNRSEVDLDLLAYQPAAWYINGEYYGMISIREKSDEFWVEDNYGIPANQIDVLEEDSLVVVGDFEKFDEHYAFTQDNDLAQAENFTTAASFFDTKNIADYFALHSAVNSADWLHNNIKYWRERSEEGKWRYLSFDMDIAMARHGWTAIDIDVFGNKMLRDYDGQNRHVNILTALLTNENYRNYFANRYCDLLNTVLRPEIFAETTRAMKDEIQSEMVRHFQRWDNCYECYSYEYWDEDQTVKAIEFAEQRAPVAREYVREYFNLENEVLLELDVFPTYAGRIQINTIKPDELPWNGYYLNGIPVQLTAIPNPGFEFQHWQSEQAIPTENSQQSIELNFSTDDKIIAYFDGEFAGLNANISPNPLTNDDLSVNFVLPQPLAVDFELYSADGKLVQQFAERTLEGGAQRVDLTTENLAKGMYFLTINGGELKETVKFVKL